MVHFYFPVLSVFIAMNVNKAVFDKSKVVRKKKLLQGSQSEKSFVTKQIGNISKQPKSESISAYEFFETSEFEMLHRLQQLTKRMKRIEKRLVAVEMNEKSNQTCETIAVQTDDDTEKFEQIVNLESENSSNLKIVDLNETQSQVSQTENLDLTSSIQHLERRMDRIMEFLQTKRPPYMRSNQFAVGDFGNSDEIKNVEQLFLRSAEIEKRKSKKLQSVVIINESIQPQVKI